MRDELDKVRDNLAVLARVQDLQEFGETMHKQLEAKIEVKEVQNALNLCQQDLAEQLAAYKQVITEKCQNIEITLGR